MLISFLKLRQTPAVSQVFVPQNRRAGDVQSYVDAEARLHPIEDDPQDDRDLVPRIDRIAKKYATHRRDQTEKDAREALDALLYSCSSHDLNLFRWLLNGLERLHESQMPIPRGLVRFPFLLQARSAKLTFCLLPLYSHQQLKSLSSCGPVAGSCTKKKLREVSTSNHFFADSTSLFPHSGAELC